MGKEVSVKLNTHKALEPQDFTGIDFFFSYFLNAPSTPDCLF